jgi:hypothetical protein
MQIVYERCAGLDVHNRTVVVCAITPDAKDRRYKGPGKSGALSRRSPHTLA